MAHRTICGIGTVGRRVLGAGTALGLIAASTLALAEPHGRRGHDDHRGGRHWGPGRYYAPPPVVYGGGYYPPPPVVYGPGVGINIHIH